MDETHNYFKVLHQIDGGKYDFYCTLLSELLNHEYAHCTSGDCRRCVIPLYAALKGW